MAFPTIDTHAHAFKHGLKLASVVRYVPSYEATGRRYLEELDAHGVRYGVLIQPSFLGTDNSYLLECLALNRDRLRGVAVVDPATPLDELLRLSDAGIVGVRLNLIGMPLPDLNLPVWRAHLETLARLDWQVEVQCKTPEHALLAPTLIAAGVNLVVDHFGLPDPEKGAEDAIYEQLLSLGASRRLWIKLSAPYRLGPDAMPFARTLYARLKEKVGLDRLMWGSDWPNTQFESTENYAGNRAFLDHLAPDPEERDVILGSSKALFRF
ncbi:MAG: amidohydrolase family protein [Elsteraceae bacterium]